MHRHSLIIALIGLAMLAGCRGTESEEPPIHLNLNMDFQQRFEAQEANVFFENDAAMRPLVPGTVARGMLQENVRFFEGRTEDGQFVEELPVPITRALLERGQERYNIYCAVCHGRAGTGQGVIMTGDYGYAPAPSYHTDRLRQVPDGYLFDVISNGIRNMPAYGAQVPVADRWAIVAYIRALQYSQHATAEDLPPSVLARVEARTGGNIEGGRTVAPAGDAGAAEDAAAEDIVEDAAPEEAARDEATVAEETSTPDAEADAGEANAGEVVAAQEEPVEEEPLEEPVEEPLEEEDPAGAPVPADADVEAPVEEPVVPPAAREADVELGNEGEGLSTSVLLVIFVALPIVALMVLLVTAFRKKREH